MPLPDKHKVHFWCVHAADWDTPRKIFLHSLSKPQHEDIGRTQIKFRGRQEFSRIPKLYLQISKRETDTFISPLKEENHSISKGVFFQRDTPIFCVDFLPFFMRNFVCKTSWEISVVVVVVVVLQKREDIFDLPINRKWNFWMHLFTDVQSQAKTFAVMPLCSSCPTRLFFPLSVDILLDRYWFWKSCELFVHPEWWKWKIGYGQLRVFVLRKNLHASGQ